MLLAPRVVDEGVLQMLGDAVDADPGVLKSACTGVPETPCPAEEHAGESTVASAPRSVTIPEERMPRRSHKETRSLASGLGGVPWPRLPAPGEVGPRPAHSEEADELHGEFARVLAIDLRLTFPGEPAGDAVEELSAEDTAPVRKVVIPTAPASSHSRTNGMRGVRLAVQRALALNWNEIGRAHV